MIWLYGKKDCPWCEKARLLLALHEIEFTYHCLDQYPMLRDPSWKTVPQCYDGIKHIGGFEALAEYLEQEYLVG